MQCRLRWTEKLVINLSISQCTVLKRKSEAVFKTDFQKKQMLTSHLNVHPNLILVIDNVKYFSFPHFPVLVSVLDKNH